MKLLARVFVLLLLLPSTAWSVQQGPRLLSYQGVLTDNASNLVPDGAYDITFRLFDVVSGGVALYTETQTGTIVQRGGFSVLIGSVVSLTLPFDKIYYLEIQVAPDATPLTPRVRLADSPYALALRIPYAGGFDTGSAPAFSMTNAGPGPDILAANRLDVGTSAAGGTGEINVSLAGASSPVVQITDLLGEGGRIGLNDELGNPIVGLEADLTGSGGFFSVARGVTGNAFTVNGNSGPSGDPVVQILGATRSATFNMNISGNGSTILPVDAIAATEILDEPGVVAISSNSSIVLDGTFQTLLSRTISAPADGYALVIATCQGQAAHVTGSTSAANYGVSDAAGALPVNQDVAMLLPSTLPTGTYATPVTVHGLFAVVAGSNTFYFIAQEQAGACTALDLQLSVVFLPTSYGTIVPTEPLQAGTAGDDAHAIAAPGVGSAEIAAERREAEALNVARLEREMKAIRDELEVLKQSQDEQLQARAHVKAPKSGK